MDVPRLGIRRRRTRRWIATAGGLLLAFVFATTALTAVARRVPRLDRRALRIDAVQVGDLVRRTRGPGRLVPRETRRIAPAVDGRVERVLVRPGTPVEAETIVVELSNPDAGQLVADARSALAASRAELAALRVKLRGEVLERRARVAEAKAAYESARLEAAANAALLEHEVISVLQATRSRLTATQLAARLEIEEEGLAALGPAHAAQIEAQEARVDQLRQAHQRRREQLDALRVRAGMDGVLLSISAEPGQRLAAGTEIAWMARPGQLRAELHVPEIDARDLAVGLRAEIDTRSALVAGVVERVDPAVRSGTVTVDVALPGELPAGARADLAVDGLIDVERLTRVLHVARPANVRPEGPGTLYRVDAEGDAVRVPVRLGKASVDRVVVLEGLSPGDSVIVSDVSEYIRHDRLEVR